MLAEQRLLSLDDPVAAYWPRFALQGKRRVTIRHVLQHRSGLPPSGRPSLRDALVVTDRQRALRRIERQRLVGRPGGMPAYQPVGFGFILGEVASRATGVPLPELLRTALLEPISAHDTHLGLTWEQWPRHIPIHAGRPAGILLASVVNSRRARMAVIPPAGISTTACDLVRFYLMLLRAYDGERGLPVSKATLAQALIPTSDGQIDRSSGAPTRWSQGFQLGGPRAVPGTITPLGRLSSPRAFGHNGSGCCIAWADPDRRLAVAYLTNQIAGRHEDQRHQAPVADAIIAGTV
jgi:CubicO group peptidase (beta-lactamase class C family)